MAAPVSLFYLSLYVYPISNDIKRFLIIFMPLPVNECLHCGDRRTPPISRSTPKATHSITSIRCVQDNITSIKSTSMFP